MRTPLPWVLYHGTTAGDVQELVPRRRYTPDNTHVSDVLPAVYATDDPACAASHAFRWRSADGITLGYEEDQLILRITAAEQGCLDQPIFIYTLPADSFDEIPDVPPLGRTYRSLVPVRPVGVDAFPNVRAGMAQYGGRIVVVDDGGEFRRNEISITALGVNLKVADLARSRAFYETFGFQHIGAFDGGVIYGVGSVALLELNARHPAVAAEVFQTRITTAKTSLMVHVPSLLPVLAAADRAHIPLAVPPRRFPWKTIEVVVRDPDGFVAVFIAPDTPEEFRAVQARTAADLDRPG